MQQSSDRTSGNLRPFSANDYAVKSGDSDVRGWAVVDSSGAALGYVSELIIDTDAMKVRYLQFRGQDGQDDMYAPVGQADLDVPNRRVVLRGSGSLVRGLNESGSEDAEAEGLVEATPPGAEAADVQRLTRAEEEVRVGKRAVQAGEVRVGKHVETEHRHEDVTVTRENIRIERRPVSGAPGSAEIRASADEIRVPIIEEEVVVEKRPVVREELVVSKEEVQETRPVDVEVRREEFDVEDSRSDEARERHIADALRARGAK